MARTDTTGCLNHQHDRRYCRHHCPWYLSAVYCLTSIAQLIVYHGSHPFWRMWRHVITWPLSSLKCIGQRSGRFQKVIINKMGVLGGLFSIKTMFIVYLMTKSNKIEKFICCVICPLSYMYVSKLFLKSLQKNLWLYCCGSHHSYSHPLDRMVLVLITYVLVDLSFWILNAMILGSE
jgi:hypothetical protein